MLACAASHPKHLPMAILRDEVKVMAKLAIEASHNRLSVYSGEIQAVMSVRQIVPMVYARGIRNGYVP
jgi:hypothetical protein